MSELGLFKLEVEAFNEVTTLPMATSMTIYVGDKIHDVQMRIVGNVVGRETVFYIAISSLDFFFIDIDFGDDQMDYLYSGDPVAMVTQVQENLHHVAVKHVYDFGGDFNVTVNVSNNVNSFVIWEVFCPIIELTLISRSPWIITSPGHAVVKATVKGGRDLNYIWSFSENFEKTSVTR